MQGQDLWHGTVGIAIVCYCLAFLGFVAYLLFAKDGAVRFVDALPKAATTTTAAMHASTSAQTQPPTGDSASTAIQAAVQ